MHHHGVRILNQLHLMGIHVNTVCQQCLFPKNTAVHKTVHDSLAILLKAVMKVLNALCNVDVVSHLSRGPYCAVYAATLLLSYGFCMVMDRLGKNEGRGWFSRPYSPKTESRRGKASHVLPGAGLLKDETDYLTPLLDKMVDGATTDATIGGRIYALPRKRQSMWLTGILWRLPGPRCLTAKQTRCAFQA